MGIIMSDEKSIRASRTRKDKQPKGAELVAIANALLQTELGRIRSKHLCALLDRSRTYVHGLMVAGKLPRPISESPNSTYWPAPVVRAFLEGATA